MKRDKASALALYQGVVIVSPMMFGEGEKNQDRARFFEPGLIGCVCDGVTSSPHAAEAAQLVTAFIPVLLEGNIRENLQVICDLLMAYRQESGMMELTVPQDLPEGMQTMLREILHQKQASGYQTTLIAVRLRPGPREVVADIVKCGDSALFAFSGEGELLRSSLSPSSAYSDYDHQWSIANRWRFDPGDQILVRVEGLLGDDPVVARKSGIRERHLQNWLVCTPVHGRLNADNSRLMQSLGLVLTPADKLLVPRYLHGRQLESRGREYRCLDYSSTIRIVPNMPPEVPADGIEHRGSATLVLPDHFYAGCYDCVEDRFPWGAHLILCSDGFYSAFATAEELWGWLQEYRQLLHDPGQQRVKLESLHARLHETRGDDDMSFVWMRPAQQPDRKASDNETTPSA